MRTFLAAGLGLLALAAASAPLHAQTTDPAAAKARLDAMLDKEMPGLIATYQDLHAHPELAMQEVRTAAILAARLKKLGYTVTEKVGGTGVVAVLRNGDGPTVLVRADMDALPMAEKTGLPFSSKAPNAMHACGHDVHVTWLIAVAQGLVTLKDQWQGTVVLMGQPAEEALGGAKAMLDDGLLTRFPRPDYGLAAHVSNLPTGSVFIKEGGVLFSLGQLRHNLPRARRAWFDAQRIDRPGGDGRALRYRRADRDQPRARSRNLRRPHCRRVPGRDRAQHHPRRGAG
jgi:hypothetical protein